MRKPGVILIFNGETKAIEKVDMWIFHKVAKPVRRLDFSFTSNVNGETNLENIIDTFVIQNL